jgi:hypothetical protein
MQTLISIKATSQNIKHTAENLNAATRFMRVKDLINIHDEGNLKSFMKQVQRDKHMEERAHERSPYMCRALFEEEIANAIEANNNDTRALCFALSRYAERTFEYRTEYVIETLQ